MANHGFCIYVRERPSSKPRYIKKNLIEKFNLRPLDGKEIKPGNMGLSHNEFAKILFRQSMDELRERCRRWDRNQDFIKLNTTDKCLKVYL
jgi:hypothetical protein